MSTSNRDIKVLTDAIMEAAHDQDAEVGTVIAACIAVSSAYAIASDVPDPKGRYLQTFEEIWAAIAGADAAYRGMSPDLRDKIFR